ncbi:MAG: flagellar brake protein [Betaproteobacteria bacterium]
MAETEVPADSEKSPPRFELEQSDEYSRFLLHSKTEIVSVLRTLIQKGALVTVHFDQGYSFLLTSLLALTADNNGFILDLGSDSEMNRKALLSNKLILTTVVDKVKIQFKLNGLTTTQHEGRAAFLAKLPEALLRLQRREFFRLSTPIATPINLVTELNRADGSTMNLDVPLLDVSGGGIGLMAVPDLAELFTKGESLSNCKINLPEEGLLVVTLFIRNMFDVTTRSGAQYVRVGCEFVDIPSARLNMVQRYITRVERERKARLSGLS